MSEATPAFRSGFVAVIGKPNVGKSTLVNHLVGCKVSIVSPRPQTTRRRILGILNRPDAQIVFVDTPGIHKPKYKLGERMVEAAVGALPDADLILFVVDASKQPNAEDQHIAELLRKEGRAPIILVLNKMDKLPPEKVKLNTEAYWQLVPDHADWMMTNAVKGHNCDKLLSQILKHLPEGPPYFPQEQITDQPERLFAAELIREKVLLCTYQEVPHGVGVAIEQWQERPNGVLYIAATIYVERETHKGIVIGEHGQLLKKIGQRAREELELWLERKIFLELWVKVREEWRNNPSFFQQLES
ncbi:MAG: GTPase Era [Fimbriimonadales bacterium]|nr:MAG: GTPase Era [Fimbriimonadales bacterium]